MSAALAAAALGVLLVVAGMYANGFRVRIRVEFTAWRARRARRRWEASHPGLRWEDHR